jgi:ADP-L-glycero-D-manno-heptose 6-epimerase
MDKIIITGTHGFVGSNLKTILEEDFEIIEINEDVFKGDWRDSVSLHFWFDIKYVFHIGACSDTLETDVNYMMTRNFEFTRHLVDLCKTKKVPLIYSSSAANYGTNNEHPSNLYGWSKYAAECYVISNGGIALRYFNVYGPGEEHKGKMSSVAFQMFQKHQKEEKVYLFPKKPKRDFVYIKDVLRANVYAAKHFSELLGKYYEVGSGKAEAFEKVLNTLQIPFEYVSEKMIPVGYQFFTESTPKKWMKGWEPIYDLESGLLEYKEYLEKKTF